MMSWIRLIYSSLQCFFTSPWFWASLPSITIGSLVYFIDKSPYWFFDEQDWYANAIAIKRTDVDFSNVPIATKTRTFVEHAKLLVQAECFLGTLCFVALGVIRPLSQAHGYVPEQIHAIIMFLLSALQAFTFSGFLIWRYDNYGTDMRGAETRLWHAIIFGLGFGALGAVIFSIMYLAWNAAAIFHP